MNASKVALERVLPLRELFLQEANRQIRYNACHERGWTDSYLLTLDHAAVGYGSIKGQTTAGRDTVFELYVVPAARRWSRELFIDLLAASAATYIECQTNDPVLSPLLYEFGRDINASVMLFDDRFATDLAVAGATVRRRRPDDHVFDHTLEPVGDYVVTMAGEVVATGGFMLHYNAPFADLYMEVRLDRRRQGLGSLLVQELKKACYGAGRVPAARCGIANLGSRGALIRAGLRPCGFMALGHVEMRRGRGRRSRVAGRSTSTGS
jgi:GNAT superfamily N-acetyltransferase